jgi:hypothetical protein
MFRNNLNEIWDFYHGMIDKSVNKHLETQRRLNFHTLFIFFSSSKNICNPSPSTSDVIKITQFNKEKIWSVWCKDIQYSMMCELKQIRISN